MNDGLTAHHTTRSYGLRAAAERSCPELFEMEAQVAGAKSVSAADADLLFQWEPFARHAYDSNVRPWLDQQEGWVLLHQVCVYIFCVCFASAVCVCFASAVCVCVLCECCMLCVLCE